MAASWGGEGKIIQSITFHSNKKRKRRMDGYEDKLYTCGRGDSQLLPKMSPLILRNQQTHIYFQKEKQE